MDYTNDQGFILTGGTNHTPEQSDLCLIKINKFGSIEWHKTYGLYLIRESGSCVRQTEDGGFVITGHKHNGKYIKFLRLFSDVWIIKTDSMGNSYMMKSIINNII